MAARVAMYGGRLAARYIARRVGGYGIRHGGRVMGRGLKRSAVAAGVAAGGYAAYKRSRRTKVGDPSSYKQLASVKRSYGRKSRPRKRAALLWKTVTTPYRLRFGQVQDINAASGTYWLSQSNRDENTTRMPVYAVALTNIVNGVVEPAFKLFELNCKNAGGWYWSAVLGTNPILGTGNVAYTDTIIPPTEVGSGTNGVGRKGLLDWVRIKLCIWGKKQNPTNVRIRLVRFTNEELSPNYELDRATGQSRDNNLSRDAADYWSEVVKYNVNGHMAGYSRIRQRSGVKTLKEWDIAMNPIDAGAETSTSDPRAHMKHLDLFHRFNRIVEYAERPSLGPQTYADLVDINKVPPVTTGYGGYPSDHWKGLWLVIESVQPDAPDVAASTANPRPAPATGSSLCASFDLLVDTSFTKLETIT